MALFLLVIEDPALVSLCSKRFRPCYARGLAAMSDLHCKVFNPVPDPDLEIVGGGGGGGGKKKFFSLSGLSLV